MQTPVSLKSAERKAFRVTFSDGLWDILLGCFVLEFALAPLFSETLGDFWSSAIFLPIWGLVYLAIWLVRKHVIEPRIGTVNFSQARKSRLRKVGLVMLAANLLLFIFGVVIALSAEKTNGGWSAGGYDARVLLFGLVVLAGFTLAAYMLEAPRLYFYGLLLFAAPLVGEWLYAQHGFAHHGYPVVFGFSAGLMFLIGLGLFVRLLKNNPPVDITQAEI